MNKKIVIAAVLVAAGIGAAALWKLQPWRAPTDGDAVFASGTVDATEVVVSFRVPGTLRKRPVEEGSVVNAGDLIAALDDRETLARLHQAEAARQAAQARLADLEQGYRPQEIAEARAQVEQARANLEQTRAQIPALESALAAAEHRLAILAGQAPGSLHARLAAGTGLPQVPASIAVGIPADTLRQRPDVHAAERVLAAETARLGVAEAARYPAFRLSGSIGLEALTLGGLGEGGAGTHSLLAALAAPIFNAGRLRAQVEIQDAVRERAQATYQATVLTALEDVENALVALARSREREQALASGLDAARNAAALARDRYSAGLIDFQAVLDTERSVLSLQDGLASTRADGLAALVRLYKALGGGWSPTTPTSTLAQDTP